MRKFKKIIFTLLLACSLISTITSTSKAASVTKSEENEVTKKVGEGYTVDGVHYEVYDVYTSDSLDNSNKMSEKRVSNQYAQSYVIKRDIRRVIVYGAIMDFDSIPNTISWDEVIYGDHYYGTLTKDIVTWDHTNKRTSVWYEGTVTCYLNPMN